jgi:hypothetical protein
LGNGCNSPLTIFCQNCWKFIPRDDFVTHREPNRCPENRKYPWKTFNVGNDCLFLYELLSDGKVESMIVTRNQRLYELEFTLKSRITPIFRSDSLEWNSDTPIERMFYSGDFIEMQEDTLGKLVTYFKSLTL